MSDRLPDRMLGRVPQRYRDRIPPEIPELWERPERARVLLASALAMFALAIFPPFLSPGAQAIQNALKEDPSSLNLVVLLGIALGAGTLLLGGAVGDASGHRRWLLVGLWGLVVTCLIGVFWQDDRGLLVVGILAAFWSGFALPLGIAVLADAYPDRAVQDMAIGLGLGALGAAQIVAPVTMDVLADLLGVWAVYILPIVAGGLALTLVRRNVPEQTIPPDLRPRHVIGQAFAAAVPLTIATFLIMLLPGESATVAVVGLGALAVVWVLALLIRRRRGRGLLPAGVVPGRMVIVALFAGVFMAFAVNAPLLYFGSFLRVIRDWGEWVAAAGLVPHLIPLFIGGIFAPVFTVRYGYVKVIVASMAILSIGCAGFALASVDTGYLWFVVPMALLGGGIVFGATARAGLILFRMPKELPGFANALNLAALELGAILGQTVMTVLMIRFASVRYEELLVESGHDARLIAPSVEEFRRWVGTIAPGGSTAMLTPTQIEGLLPGFREALAGGLSSSLWLVTLITVVGTIATILLFRWAGGSRADRDVDPLEWGGSRAKRPSSEEPPAVA